MVHDSLGKITGNIFFLGINLLTRNTENLLAASADRSNL